jgi:PIN domain
MARPEPPAAGTHARGRAGAPLRLCLDLNIWCAAFLADKSGRTGTAAQELIAIVRRGECALGLTQLVISWGMLTRLRKVLVDDWEVDPSLAEAYTAVITGYARLGPAGVAPYLLLGGTGVMPLRDSEDAHVLEVAMAGLTDVLVTRNFGDFTNYRTDVLVPGRVALHHGVGHDVVIADPRDMLTWVRAGRIDLPARAARKAHNSAGPTPGP